MRLTLPGPAHQSFWPGRALTLSWPVGNGGCGTHIIQFHGETEARDEGRTDVTVAEPEPESGTPDLLLPISPALLTLPVLSAFSAGF